MRPRVSDPRGYRVTGSRQTWRMTDETDGDRALASALKAADEVAAALQAHLTQEHKVSPERTPARNTSSEAFDLLRHARERLATGLRAIGE